MTQFLSTFAPTISPEEWECCSIWLARSEGLRDYPSVLGFASSPPTCAEHLGQRCLAEFPARFHTGLANLHMLLLQSEMLSVRWWLPCVVVPSASTVS